MPEICFELMNLSDVNLQVYGPPMYFTLNDMVNKRNCLWSDFLIFYFLLGNMPVRCYSYKKMSNKLCSYCLIIFKCTVHKRSTNLNFKYKIGQIFVCPLFHCAPAISHICHTTATSEQQLISISYISLPWLLRFFQSIEPSNLLYQIPYSIRQFRK